MVTQLADRVEPLISDLVAVRRDLHAHPELSFEEQRTAQLIAQRLDALGCQVRRGVGGHGVVGVLKGGHLGSVVGLRADIDALPIEEANEVAYRSQTHGVMHACGHDGHVAALLGAAEVLANQRESLRGTVVFLFQPAEERAGGAEIMIREGALSNPRPEALFGIHLWNNLPVGTIGIRPGPIFAAADEVNILVRGRGGHGALPHQTVDPVVIAAEIVMSLQTLVSREVSPLETAVLSIGSIHGGSAFNIIPADVRLSGTVRTFDEQLQRRLRERIEAKIRGITDAAGAEYEFEYSMPCPPVINDPAMADFVHRVSVDEFGEAAVVHAEPTMGGDDMAFFLREVPGAYFFVGAANGSRGLDKPHHNAGFDFDEAALPVATRVLARVTLEYLETHQE